MTEITAIADSRYASRKFLLATAVVAGSTALLVLGDIDRATWADLVRWVVGLYMAGNVGSALAGRAS